MFIVISAISCYAFSTVKDLVVGAGVVLGGLLGGRGGSYLLVSRYSVWGSCSKNSKATKRIQFISVSQSVSCDQDPLLPSRIQTKCRHQLEEKTDQGSTYAFLGRIYSYTFPGWLSNIWRASPSGINQVWVEVWGFILPPFLCLASQLT